MPQDTTLERTHPAPPKRPDPCADDKPVCPACGGLQCLCRPRFFPGQLLTDEDLNRLQRYIIEKNRLHARYLHGWGVACGLEVVCDPCASSNVVVRTGYALSPCGDDIIVCNDHSVNVCALIDECRPQAEVVCDPPYHQPPRECRDGTEDWVLAICYDERPSRGITALTGSTDSACCSGCACGGGSCGCKAGAKPAITAAKKKAYKPQCEPTQICEGYRFTAYKLPPAPKDTVRDRPQAGNRDLMFAWMYANRARFGPLIERLLCCMTAALELRATFGEGKYARGSEAADAYRDYLEALRDFAATFALHDCRFVDKLVEGSKDSRATIESLRNVSSLSNANKTLVAGAMQRLDETLFSLIAECFCSALLPACPDPAPDNCVPLALLTVRTRDCRVVTICNWQARKLLITWRSIGYWLSWLPWDRLRQGIAQLCCGQGRERGIYWIVMLLLGRVFAQTRTQRAFAMGAAAEGTADPLKAAFEARDFMGHFATGFDRVRSGEDADAPPWASFLARVADGSALAPLAGGAAVERADIDDLKSRVGVEELRRQVSDLQATLAEYKTTMDGLKTLMRGHGG